MYDFAKDAFRQHNNGTLIWNRDLLKMHDNHSIQNLKDRRAICVLRMTPCRLYEVYAPVFPMIALVLVVIVIKK
jgi:hypothetical protein